LLREVPVNKVKEFEEHFLMEMDNKLPDVLAEFKKGNLTDDSDPQDGGAGQRHHSSVQKVITVSR
jgi:uncharacterized protein (DUF1786 family)